VSWNEKDAQSAKVREFDSELAATALINYKLVSSLMEKHLEFEQLRKTDLQQRSLFEHKAIESENDHEAKLRAYPELLADLDSKLTTFHQKALQEQDLLVAENNQSDLKAKT